MASFHEVEMVQEHIRLGATHITRQHRIIEHLRDLGADVELALDVLANLQDSQTLHHVHLRRALRA